MFKYSVECAYHKISEKKRPEKFFHYRNLESDLDFESITFPANNHDIDRFEESNKSVSKKRF